MNSERNTVIKYIVKFPAHYSFYYEVISSNPCFIKQDVDRIRKTYGNQIVNLSIEKTYVPAYFWKKAITCFNNKVTTW